MRPIVALLTDFGSQDHYAGAVKGAILAACREANLVDIAHDLPPHDVQEAAFALFAAHRSFPAATVFVAVVDPGVGSERRGIAVQAGGYRFVGPDNGIFSLIYEEYPDAGVHHLTNAGLFRYEVSPTFHGRDVFGPVAGHLANGTDISVVGPRVDEPVRFEIGPVRRCTEREWEARVLHVDRFGNLTTNLSQRELEQVLSYVDGDPTQIVVLVEGVVLPLVRSYFELPEGEGCALLGSSGRLEVAVNRGSAARVFGATKGAPVRLRLVPTEG
jgi:S-adenosylmethionine hydrolase